jgi:hypothetical protein
MLAVALERKVVEDLTVQMVLAVEVQLIEVVAVQEVTMQHLLLVAQA